MRNFLLLLLYLEVAFLVEGTIRHLPFTTLRVDLVWLLVVFLGFNASFRVGVIAVFFLGLVQESLGVPIHGLVVFPYLLVFLFLLVARGQIFSQGHWAQLTWILILSLGRSFLEQLLLLWQGYPFVFDLWHEGGAALLNGAASLVLFPFLKKRGRIGKPYGAGLLSRETGNL